MPAPIPVEQQFSEEVKSEIAKLYVGGMTQQQLADKFEVPRRTMMKLCAKLGLHKDHSEAQKSKFDNGFVDKVAALRVQGKTLHQIADETGHSVSGVHRAVGVTGACKPESQIDETGVVEAYVRGDNLLRIAKNFSISTYIVKQVLVKNNVQLRPTILSGGAKIKYDTISLPDFEDTNDWFNLAYTKYGMSSIAKFLGRSVGYVANKLDSYGIKTRTISERGLILDRPSVLATYTELGSMQKTARRFNCTIQAIKNILLDNEITPRTASEILSGDGNPFFGKQHSDETKKFCTEIGTIHGVKFWIDHPEYVEVARAKCVEYWSDLSKRYENSKRIATLRKEGKCGARRGAIESKFGVLSYDSSYELQFIEFCETDKRIVWLERDFDTVDYEYNGNRVYVPDFRLWLDNGEFLIVEIKSDWYSKQDKERQKIIAGFGQFADKFMVLSGKLDFKEVTNRIDISLAPLEFDLSNVELREVDSVTYDAFYGCFHYLGKGGRRGFTIGAFLAGKLIGAATISSITRAETATKQGLTQSEMRELVRFCIHPDFHKKNLASWFLSRVVRFYKNANPSVRMLVAFADSSQGHIGTVYKSSNWVDDGVTGASYHYLDQSNAIIHKKTVYDQAKRIGSTESNFVSSSGLKKVVEAPKRRFLLNL